MNWTVVISCLLATTITGAGVYRSCTLYANDRAMCLVIDGVFAVLYAVAFGFAFR